MSDLVPSRDDEIRQLLFTPCETKEALARWIRVFLGPKLFFPDTIVSDESNSSPMDMIWEVYNKARLNNDPDFSRVMAYANRGGFKTLGASVLEVLQVLHLGRNVAHMAAIFDQSKKSQEYVRDFFASPYIRDFRIGQNVKKIEICRYYNSETGRSLTEKEWLDLSSEAKMAYERKYNYIQIVLCTMQGANSAHTEFLCVDEVDVVPKQHIRAYEEAKHIPDPRDGLQPITLLTSTRKFSYGLVQTEIANSSETGLHVRHWNVIDITQACLPERHEPEKPKQTYYINDSTLRHITEEDYKLLDEQNQKKFYPREGFAGCKKCPLFSACKGRLATHQTSQSTMLKPISSIINSFKQSSAAAVQTQLLCRKPDASGLIYPKFERETHMKTASQMAEMITGEKHDQHMTKAQLLQLMLDKGARFYAGMDFGFTHNFAVTVAAVFGQFMFIFTVIAMPNLELDEKVAVCEPLKTYSPTIFGDEAYPADIKTFKRKGFNMREWSKYPGSVKAGIEVVRMKLMPAVGVPQMFLLKDDPGCEFLASRIEKYHFMTDAGGHISEEPDKDEDDEVDAMRYMVMNVFAPKGKINIPNSKSSDLEDIRKTIAEATGNLRPGQPANFLKEQIASLTGEVSDGGTTKTVRRGKFVFDG
jgi:hypothetical protein